MEILVDVQFDDLQSYTRLFNLCITPQWVPMLKVEILQCFLFFEQIFGDQALVKSSVFLNVGRVLNNGYLK